MNKLYIWLSLWQPDGRKKTYNFFFVRRKYNYNVVVVVVAMPAVVVALQQQHQRSFFAALCGTVCVCVVYVVAIYGLDSLF